MATPPDTSVSLFLAIWPAPSTAQALARWQHDWSWPANAARVAPHRLHVTLHFIGAVPAARVGGLRAALKVDSSPAELSLGAAAVWPGGIAVALLESPPATLQKVRAGLAAALEEAGLPVETRPWKPHVTLARKAAGAVPPRSAANVHWAWDGRYQLVRTAAGGVYEVLHVFP